MSPIRYRVKVSSEYEADAVIGDTMVEVKRDLREGQRLSGILFQLAEALAHEPGRKAVLLLEKPTLTRRRLESAWESAQQLFRPELARRLRIWIKWENEYDGFPSRPDSGDIGLIDEILDAPETNDGLRGPGRRDSLSEVLRLLLCRWLREEGPLTVQEIGETLGYTFRPVRAALDQMQRYLKAGRGVELAAFPREPWRRLVDHARTVRRTLRFSAGRGGRLAGVLLDRFRALQPPNAAVGGVEGARHYCPELDLIGLPRLDLCVHQIGNQSDLGFVPRLDPGLERTNEEDLPAPLVIHFLCRKASLFDRGWADPVECLLDLHELRLEEQALQFLRSFPAARKESF